MLEQPWPAPGPGPQQPRDAHRQHWANDAHRRPRTGATRPRRSSVDPWGGATGREPAVRRRSDELRRYDVVGSAPRDDVPEPDRHRDRPEHAGGADRPRPEPTRWVPAEEWIPDPTPSPEQRWSPEQDWLAAFAHAPVPDAQVAAAEVRARRRRALAAAALALALALVAGLVTVA